MAFLQACATRPSLPPPVDGFELRGRLSVREAADRYSGSFVWRQRGARFDIDLWGPLGQGRVHLAGDEQRLRILNGAGEVVRSGNRDEVMLAELGFSMPLDVLTAWVLGAPDPELPAHDQVRDGDSRIRSFTQAGWRIGFDDYREVAQADSTRWLPRRVDASRGETTLRLLISSWQLGESI